ncbi:MATE family efflux transporter [Helicobacter mustelae]|uniref:Putative MATE efflux family protein n=1 Tax=Helicobacter mustelae (strain ATCC 43772 / CCUG 25715 / CIP 103759 / LMG 18044 / NCTC 12198 / R85-136P) TaxID=679897 RepID=D3UH99_HELM1|nr:MATE family efflux transporter [Helicobacter mustelae]CBG39871.1 putative MATE efflux family protein [Helicobacter mustelae 12198]SQH71381.1 MATE efflux family protein [Helicobacter mustelae]STP12509.1 MATE efflux family protein [Helicobacter mustelae]
MKKLSLKALSIPIFLEIFLHYASLMINTYMVAGHSNFLVGSMGVGNQIFDLFITIFNFLSIGCSVFIAQSIGARDLNLANSALHQSLGLNFLVGAVCGGVIYFFASELLLALHTSQELFSQASIYLKSLAICIFLESTGIILASVLRVYNQAYLVSLTSLLMNLLQILLNYFVLYHTSLELLGIGVATIIGRIVFLALLLWVLFYQTKILLNLKKLFYFQGQILKKILNIGGFSAGENLLWIVQYTIAFSFVNELGPTHTSVQTIYFQISLLIMLIGQAISMANEIIVGKLIGANAFKVAYKHTWIALYISVFSSFIVALVNFLYRDFTLEKLHATSNFEAIMLPLFALSLVLETGRTFNIVMVSALRASGDAKFPFFSGCIFMFGVSLPVGYILCFYFGLGILGVWIGFCADEWMRGICNALRWRSKKHKNIQRL